MYHLEISTKGMKESFQFTEATKIHQKINETLEQVSITYQSKMLLGLRTLQRKLKKIPNNDFIIFKVEKSIVQITKLKKD